MSRDAMEKIFAMKSAMLKIVCAAFSNSYGKGIFPGDVPD